MIIEALTEYKYNHLGGDKSGSGAGTRTPDTRIMIPLL